MCEIRFGFLFLVGVSSLPFLSLTRLLSRTRRICRPPPKLILKVNIFYTKNTFPHITTFVVLSYFYINGQPF